MINPFCGNLSGLQMWMEWPFTWKLWLFWLHISLEIKESKHKEMTQRCAETSCFLVSSSIMGTETKMGTFLELYSVILHKHSWT